LLEVRVPPVTQLTQHISTETIRDVVCTTPSPVDANLITNMMMLGSMVRFRSGPT
jgi:hypothetical protein